VCTQTIIHAAPASVNWGKVSLDGDNAFSLTDAIRSFAEKIAEKAGIRSRAPFPLGLHGALRTPRFISYRIP
jgi:hypothetical protein